MHLKIVLRQSLCIPAGAKRIVQQTPPKISLACLSKGFLFTLFEPNMQQEIDIYIERMIFKIIEENDFH
jgi:hypothetical protein